jgi:hypothetical protein
MKKNIHIILFLTNFYSVESSSKYFQEVPYTHVELIDFTKQYESSHELDYFWKVYRELDDTDIDIKKIFPKSPEKTLDTIKIKKIIIILDNLIKTTELFKNFCSYCKYLNAKGYFSNPNLHISNRDIYHFSNFKTEEEYVKILHPKQSSYMINHRIPLECVISVPDLIMESKKEQQEYHDKSDHYCSIFRKTFQTYLDSQKIKLFSFSLPFKFDEFITKYKAHLNNVIIILNQLPDKLITVKEKLFLQLETIVSDYIEIKENPYKNPLDYYNIIINLPSRKNFYDTNNVSCMVVNFFQNQLARTISYIFLQFKEHLQFQLYNKITPIIFKKNNIEIQGQLSFSKADYTNEGTFSIAPAIVFETEYFILSIDSTFVSYYTKKISISSLPDIIKESFENFSKNFLEIYNNDNLSQEKLWIYFLADFFNFFTISEENPEKKEDIYFKGKINFAVVNEVFYRNYDDGNSFLLKKITFYDLIPLLNLINQVMPIIKPKKLKLELNKDIFTEIYNMKYFSINYTQEYKTPKIKSHRHTHEYIRISANFYDNDWYSELKKVIDKKIPRNYFLFCESNILVEIFQEKKTVLEIKYFYNYVQITAFFHHDKLENNPKTRFLLKLLKNLIGIKVKVSKNYLKQDEHLHYKIIDILKKDSEQGSFIMVKDPNKKELILHLTKNERTLIPIGIVPVNALNKIRQLVTQCDIKKNPLFNFGSNNPQMLAVNSLLISPFDVPYDSITLLIKIFIDPETILSKKMKQKFHLKHPYITKEDLQIFINNEIKRMESKKLKVSKPILFEIFSFLFGANVNYKYFVKHFEYSLIRYALDLTKSKYVNLILTGEDNQILSIMENPNLIL